jgi:polyisoprenoid-binding protein YceI
MIGVSQVEGASERSTPPGRRRRGSTRSVFAAAVVLTTCLVLPAGGCSDPAADKFQATATPPKPEDPAPRVNAFTTSPRLLLITPEGSTIGFVGSKVTGSHEGAFRSFSGFVALSRDLKSVEKVSVDIVMSSAFTDNDKLTTHLLGPEFFDVARFPVSSFSTTAIEPTDREGATHTLTGNLTMHGVDRSITFPARIAVGDGSVAITAEFAINRKDFGVSYPGQSDDLIRDEVVLRVDVKAPRPPS